MYLWIWIWTRQTCWRDSCKGFEGSLSCLLLLASLRPESWKTTAGMIIMFGDWWQTPWGKWLVDKDFRKIRSDDFGSVDETKKVNDADAEFGLQTSTWDTLDVRLETRRATDCMNPNAFLSSNCFHILPQHQRLRYVTTSRNSSCLPPHSSTRHQWRRGMTAHAIFTRNSDTD